MPTSTTARVLRWERRPEERPNELLEAALRIFAERGYSNTRLEDIAAAVGVTKGTIYHYFETKEDLLRQAIDHYHERVFLPLEKELSVRKASASATIRLFLRRAFGNLDPARLNVLTLLVQGVAREVPHVYQRWLETGPARGWQILAEQIAHVVGIVHASDIAHEPSRRLLFGSRARTEQQKGADHDPEADQQTFLLHHVRQHRLLGQFRGREVVR